MSVHFISDNGVINPIPLRFRDNSTYQFQYTSFLKPESH